VTTRKPTVDYRVTKLHDDLVTIHGEDTATVRTIATEQEIEDDYQDYLVQLFHPIKGDYMIQAVKRNSHLLAEYNEKELRENADVKERDELLRMSFWEEMTRAETERTPVKEVNIWRGICTKVYWDRVVREYDNKFAFVLTPPRKKRLMTKLIHHEGLGRLHEIINAPMMVKNKYGQEVLDHKTAKLILEAWKLANESLYGTAVQRIQKHVVNEGSTGQLTPAEAALKLAELKKQIDDAVVTVKED